MAALTISRWQAVLPFVVATLGELSALGYWLHNRDAQPWLARGALWLGFAVERGAVAYWLRREHRPGTGIHTKPLAATILGLLFATVFEIAVWTFWVWSDARWNLEIAGLLLFVLIHGLHAQEMASVRNQTVVRFLVRPKTIYFSLAEAVGATVWLWLTHAGHPWLGLTAMFVGLFIEHFIQGKELVDEDFRR